jgi:uncharacterized cupredoxin-like copper-binding protein
VLGVSDAIRIRSVFRKEESTVFKRLGLFLSIAMVSIVVLAACGGDDDGNGNGDGGGNGSSNVDMEMGEMYFDPDEVSADAGSTVSINFENAGGQLHDFTIDDLDGERVHVEVPAGEEDSVSLDIPEDVDEIVFYCSVPGHRDAGMEGVISVN